MNEKYVKLMMQQNMSNDAAFYEKLENLQPRRKHWSGWKPAIVAACVLLLIPVSVWAAESIFGITKVTHTVRPTYDNKPGVGMDIVYENLEDYHIEDFSKHLQEVKEYEEVVHENWATAEEYLGIDLVDNVHFTANDTYCRAAFGERGKNAHSTCWAYNEQLFASRVVAEFERDHTVFLVRAMVSVDLPEEIKEDVYNYYHGYSITYYERDNLQVETQQYMTKAGIPVLIVTVTDDENYSDRSTYNDWKQLQDCIAFFAVNNVTYSVHATCKCFGTDDLDRYANPKEKVMPALLEFLDGFVIE